MSNYRSLTEKETATLVVYGCTAENWKKVQVVTDFKPDYVSNTFFSGEIKLGRFEKIFELPGGVKKHSGIFNAHLHNCIIENDVYINKTNNYIANYDIKEASFIENVDCILAENGTTFGNGTQVSCMVESGGREVPLFNELSAPLAYIIAFYRHDKDLTTAFENTINQHIKNTNPIKGIIGKETVITNCGTIKNVCIGDFLKIEGTSLLENGTIVSNEKAPVTIGADVQMNDFIVQSGSSVTDGAMLTRCFVGQSCIIGKQFSAIDSLFFANSQGLHGEAISILAGPYTVTHHKSTLMLTALYSFMNAGSGTNFSNHMYKLGPVHQGITERGVKTSSGSYIMWPARIGAFSVVLGRHKGNPDLSNLPFSYLIETEGESNLLPGINLHSAGTMRDVEKWQKRDLRKDEKIDPICFDFLSPYTISKAVKGIEILKDLLAKIDAGVQFVWYQNCKLKKAHIQKGIDLYEKAIDSFIASTLKNQKETKPISVNLENWVDLLGLIAPKSEVDDLCEKIVSEKLSVEEIQKQLLSIFDLYSSYSFAYAQQLAKIKYQNFNQEDLKTIEEKGKTADDFFNDMILRDAKKEFNLTSKIGFGIDGNEETRDADFENVRGSFDEHPFVKRLMLDV